jgi:transposase
MVPLPDRPCPSPCACSWRPATSGRAPVRPWSLWQAAQASRAGQPENPDFDREAYRRRNAVERLVGKLKQFRRVATRYDKLDAHYLAFVQIASIMVWLRSFGDMA